MNKRWRRCDDDLDDMILCLNNMATSGLYTSKLKDVILAEAERLERHERKQVIAGCQHFLIAVMRNFFSNARCG